MEAETLFSAICEWGSRDWGGRRCYCMEAFCEGGGKMREVVCGWVEGVL